MSEYIPIAMRREVRERANGCCEYCLVHEDDCLLPHEPDHIIASKHQGETLASNLAWTCFICKRGHTRDTERKAFEATEEAMEEIVKLVRKLTSANATNVLITADHGFIYQDEIEESDFSSTEITGTETASDRRFVVGSQLKISGGAKLYGSAELGLKGDLEVAVPKTVKGNAILSFRRTGC